VSRFSVVVDVPAGGLLGLEEVARSGFLPPLSLLLLKLPFRLAFPLRCPCEFSGELLTKVGGNDGLLRFACVLCAGSDGPALGVVRESSVSSSPDGGTEDCDDEGAECETGEQGSGMITSYAVALLFRIPGVQPRCGRAIAG
jgi:hypothetical protein